MDTHITKTALRLGNEWVIDTVNTDEQYLYVDVPGYGTVCIKREDDGLVVDIFSMYVRDEAVATTWASFSDLMNDEEEE